MVVADWRCKGMIAAIVVLIAFCPSSGLAGICDTQVDLCDSVNVHGSFLFYYECDNDYKFCLTANGHINAGIDLSGTDLCPDLFDFQLIVITDCNDPVGSQVAAGTVINYTSPTGGPHFLLLRRGDDDCAYYYDVECIAGSITGSIWSCCIQTSVPPPGPTYEWGDIKRLFR